MASLGAKESSRAGVGPGIGRVAAAEVSPPRSHRTEREPLQLIRLPVSSRERLCCGHAAPPVTGWPPGAAGYRSHFGPVPLQDLHPHYGLLRACAPHRYSGSCGGFPLELPPCHRDDRFPRSTTEPDPGITPPPSRMPLGPDSRVRPNLSRRPLPSPRFRHRPVKFGTSSAVRLRSSLRITPD